VEVARGAPWTWLIALVAGRGSRDSTIDDAPVLAMQFGVPF
jgi:hypothetical protein